MVIAAGAWAMLGCAAMAGSGYDDEGVNFGVARTNEIRTQNYEAHTPTSIAGAQTVTTPTLQRMIAAKNPPLLIDVLEGSQSVSLPNAVWLKGAGMGSGLDDDVQQRLAARLQELTQGRKSQPMVFFCLSKTCWLSHNAVVRAVALGYSRVYWYRGGRNAWIAAGLPMPAAPWSSF
ncbi:MAG: rhodanese-like domain-containing protein [Roseiarcus sp.]|jgi:PQQ-dependent catabolism-associated CXXCW motif protein